MLVSIIIILITIPFVMVKDEIAEDFFGDYPESLMYII